jgi:hypothetical protein
MAVVAHIPGIPATVLRAVDQEDIVTLQITLHNNYPGPQLLGAMIDRAIRAGTPGSHIAMIQFLFERYYAVSINGPTIVAAIRKAFPGLIQDLAPLLHPNPGPQPLQSFVHSMMRAAVDKNDWRILKRIFKSFEYVTMPEGMIFRIFHDLHSNMPRGRDLRAIVLVATDYIKTQRYAEDVVCHQLSANRFPRNAALELDLTCTASPLAAAALRVNYIREEALVCGSEALFNTILKFYPTFFTDLLWSGEHPVDFALRRNPPASLRGYLRQQAR